MRKKQIISVLVLILQYKSSATPTLKQQQPQLDLQVLGAVILQEQQTVVGKKKVLRRSSLSFAEKTTSLLPERPLVPVDERCNPNCIVRK